MKFFKKNILITILLVVILSVGCKKKDNSNLTKLIIATDATWPPMEMVNEKKEIVGFDIDFINAVALAGGFEVEIHNVPWEGIFIGLNNRKYDAVISSVTITDDRRQQMDFSTPYINAGQVIIVTNKTEGFDKLEDFKKHVVGAQIGTTGAYEITKYPEIILNNYDELSFAIEDLINGRVKGVVADTPIAADYALQNPAYKGKLKIVGTPFTDEFYGIAVKKGDSKTLDLINNGVHGVLGTEVYQKIEKKWLG